MHFSSFIIYIILFSSFVIACPSNILSNCNKALFIAEFWIQELLSRILKTEQAVLHPQV